MAEILIFNSPQILLNGLSSAIANSVIHDTAVVKLCDPLNEIIAGLADCSINDAVRSKSLIQVHGSSIAYRDAILSSNEALQKVFGTNWITDIVANKVNRIEADLIIIPDVTRPSEITNLVNRLHKQHNMLLMQIVVGKSTIQTTHDQFVTDNRIHTTLVYGEDFTKLQKMIESLVDDWIGANYA